MKDTTRRQWIKVDFVHSSPASYGPAQRHLGTRRYHLGTFAQLARNADSIDWRGVTSICFDADLRVVFQAAGYTSQRGSFCDLPDIRQYAPASGEPWPYHTEEELRAMIDVVPTWAEEIMQSIAAEK